MCKVLHFINIFNVQTNNFLNCDNKMITNITNYIKGKLIKSVEILYQNIVNTLDTWWTTPYIDTNFVNRM